MQKSRLGWLTSYHKVHDLGGCSMVSNNKLWICRAPRIDAVFLFICLKEIKEASNNITVMCNKLNQARDSCMFSPTILLMLLWALIY